LAPDGDHRELASAFGQQHGRYQDRLSLICNACQRSYLIMHDEFAAFHRLEPTTPCLLINRRLRCVVCRKKNGQCRSETHGLEAVTAHSV
jgi:hypothetical protein